MYKMSKKQYYLPGIDEFTQLVETPASKERTDKHRYMINTVVSIVAAIASIIAAVVSVLAYLGN